MKTILRQTLCLILIVAMLMQVCVFATDPNTEGTALDGVRTEEPTDPTDPTDPEPTDPEIPVDPEF